MYSSSEIKRFSIDGPVLITPKAFGDDRGLFCEVYRADVFCEFVGEDVDFVQDNISVSANAGTVRGLHAQEPPYAVGKLVQCLHGSIIDVAVDARTDSPTFGKHVSVALSAENRAQLWVPAGFLHGYATQEDNTSVFYKQTGYYAPGGEISVLWDDPDLGIDWNVDAGAAVLSEKDAQAQYFANFESPFELL
ncbi:MAG: dTDP-4-dehydrorhamnose 3,5-epimerase [Robiginitomaculum sp.]|nr:dTDP-4-dehydrorhamnose 3,5-epimerase [Robiginitomaculum sp.]